MIFVLLIILLYFIYNNIYYIELFDIEPSNKKIAFLFLIYDEINNEKLWKSFFRSCDINKYSIYIHYKYYKKSNYFDKYKLKNIIPTEWGDISLVKAQNLLLKEALKDKNNTNFILLSNSCIPCKNFKYIYLNLNQKFSYFDLCSDSQYNRCQKALNYINIYDIKKSSQWSILNRKHAKLLVNDEHKYIDWFDICPDEHSYITYLFYNNLDNEIIKTTDGINAKTYVNWLDNSLVKYYNYIDKNNLYNIYNSPCFFARKFKKNFTNIDILYPLIS